MDTSREAAVIINDLDSLTYRIEALGIHPRYVDALANIRDAKQAVIEGRVDIHRSMTQRRLVKVEGEISQQ